MMTIVYAIAVGFSMATTAMVSRRIGEKKRDGASIAAAQSIVIGFVISIFLAIPGIFYARLVIHFGFLMLYVLFALIHATNFELPRRR